jgi:hypothetical protein
MRKAEQRCRLNGIKGSNQDLGSLDRSRTKTSGFNQSHLIAAGGEFPTLITLDHDTATGFDPDDPGANPTQSRGLQNFDHITGLKIQLHARNKETTK